MHQFDQISQYLSSHWWAAAAVVVWWSVAVGGALTHVENWRLRRVMRRTAKIRKKRLG